MKRDAALIPLSHQHHNGLALCVLTDRSLEKDTSAENVKRLAKRIVDRYEIELVNHFEMEEKILFPACGAELAPLVTQLIAEHREIERRVAELREGPAVERVREFGALLRRHIRLEENELFQQAQELIPREILDKIGGEIDRQAVRVCL